MRLVLASQSPSRRMLLQQGGITPVLRPAHIDEDAIIADLEDVKPRTVVQTLAQAKAATVAGDFPDDVVVGCGSMLLDGQLLGSRFIDSIDGDPHQRHRPFDATAASLPLPLRAQRLRLLGLAPHTPRAARNSSSTSNLPGRSSTFMRNQPPIVVPGSCTFDGALRSSAPAPNSAS